MEDENCFNEEVEEEEDSDNIGKSIATSTSKAGWQAHV